MELNFRAHFELPRASSSYAAFLDSLPELLVVEACRMQALVASVATRIASEFKEMVSLLVVPAATRTPQLIWSSSRQIPPTTCVHDHEGVVCALSRQSMTLALL